MRLMELGLVGGQRLIIVCTICTVLSNDKGHCVPIKGIVQ